MAVFKLRKFQGTAEMEHTLNGGLIGGAASLGGVFGLTGKTLIFNSPSSTTVTFTAGVDPNKHTFAEVKGQIETALATVRVLPVGPNGQVAIIEVTPSGGVDIDKTGTANTLLGFSADVDTVGAVYAYDPTPTPPCVFQIYYDARSGSHVAVTWE